MPEETGAGWVRLTGEGPVTDAPALLHGIVLLVHKTGDWCNVYDGVDPEVGRLVVRFEGDDNISNTLMFSKPLRMDAGIYVTMDSSADEVLVVWEPLVMAHLGDVDQ